MGTGIRGHHVYPYIESVSVAWHAAERFSSGGQGAKEIMREFMEREKKKEAERAAERAAKKEAEAVKASA